MDQYLVVGNPIDHSKSPQIHSMFARQTGEAMEYTKRKIDVGHFPDALHQLIAEGFKGVNVTVPFKEDAFQFVTDRSDRAQRAQAVNTIVIDGGGHCVADNTDGAGLVTDLQQNLNISIANKNVLLLGAGGAVRGVIAPLLKENLSHLTIANRTVDKAQRLADDFADLGQVTGCGFAELSAQSFDIIINGTSAGLAGEVPPIPDGALASEGICYDMFYADVPTAFVRWGQDRGATLAVDGLGMLVEQAAEAFYIWRGIRPDTASVVQALRGN